MEIRRYETDLLSSNMYVVREGGHAIIIDPSRDTGPAEGLRIDRIILTHEHYDHISGVLLWKEKTDAPVLCSKACAANIQDSRKNMASYFKLFCELQTWIQLDKMPESDPAYACAADEVFEDEMSFRWRGHTWRLFEMPGHSMGSIGILLDEACFFSGDSLLENDEIDLNIPGGSRVKWQEIGAPRLNQLPCGIKVYPGHFRAFFYQRNP